MTQRRWTRWPSQRESPCRPAPANPPSGLLLSPLALPTRTPLPRTAAPTNPLPAPPGESLQRPLDGSHQPALPPEQVARSTSRGQGIAKISFISAAPPIYEFLLCFLGGVVALKSSSEGAPESRFGTNLLTRLPGKEQKALLCSPGSKESSRN